MNAPSPSPMSVGRAGPNSTLPSELARRQVILDHPLIKGSPIMTPPVERAAAACKIAFFEGASAFTLAGPQGCGRRSAGLMIVQTLQMAYPSLTVLPHSFGRRPQTTVQEEWRSFVLSLDPHAPKDTLSGLRHRSMVAAANHVRRADGNGAILLVLTHLERITHEAAMVLLDFGDLLAARGHKLRVMSIAEQGEFVERFSRDSSMLKQREVDALVGKLHVLGMINPATDLSHVLKEVDEAEFPLGCSWTQFFVPKAYAAGTRLQHCSKEATDAVARLQEELHVQPTTRQLFAAIRLILGQASQRDDTSLKFEEGQWFDALYRATFSSVDWIDQLLPTRR